LRRADERADERVLTSDDGDGETGFSPLFHGRNVDGRKGFNEMLRP